jgi:hypothetical protein
VRNVSTYRGRVSRDIASCRPPSCSINGLKIGSSDDEAFVLHVTMEPIAEPRGYGRSMDEQRRFPYHRSMIKGGEQLLQYRNNLSDRVIHFPKLPTSV